MTASSHDSTRAAPTITRRRLFAGAAAATALAATDRLVGRGAAVRALAASANGAAHALPPPEASGIDHIIVVMMENRSFDHLLGWLPGADGRQGGLTYTDRDGHPHDTYPLAPDQQGCGHPDPDHSYEGGRIEYDHGACDGWLRAGQNDVYSIGYYTQPDLPFLGAAAKDWTVCDRYFSSIMAETYPNRFYQHAGVTDRLHNTMTISNLPTIWDRLAAAGRTGRYYFSDVPFLALWGSKYVPISAPYSQFLTDCAAGTLPDVSFVDPRFAGEDEGTSGDDHPHGDIRAGEYFLYQTYRAVVTGQQWSRTVMVINFDEWGGFFDHVAPTKAPDINVALRLRGFRVPALIVSPFARRSHVNHGLYDHTSILRMIEWRWSLRPLSVRDRRAGNLANALNLSHPNPDAPDYDVPVFQAGPPCESGSPGAPEGQPELGSLRGLARRHGWAGAMAEARR